MSLLDQANEKLEIMEDADIAFVEFEFEGNLEKQSAAVVFEKKNDHWDAKASIGLERILGKVDLTAKVSVRYAF